MGARGGLPDVVYHYTSVDTLLKIAEHHVIRATSIRFLNDLSERDVFLNELRERLKNDATAPSPQNVLLSHAIAHGATQRSFLDFPFVASFSRDSDSLPQWRAYSPPGSGVAIGFRTSSLLKAEAETSSVDPTLGPVPFVELAPVVYWTDRKKRGLDALLEGMIKFATEYNAYKMPIAESWAEKAVAILSTSIESHATLTKHQSFSTEREYRLVVENIRDRGKVRYRSSKATLVPYINLSIPDPDEFLGSESACNPPRFFRENPYFIHRVVVGPTPHLSLTCDALEQFFKGLGHTVRVKASSVPYRDTI